MSATKAGTKAVTTPVAWIRHVAVAVAVVAAGCSGAGGGDNVNGDDGSGSGGFPSPTCQLNLAVEPANPVASATTTIRVAAQLSEAPGGLAYQWGVAQDGVAVPTTPGNDGEISFAAATAGVYDVTLSIAGAPSHCLVGARSINVEVPGARRETVRMRVIPARAAAASPFETLVQLEGGATMDLGVTTFATDAALALRVVADTGAGVPAYIRISPRGAPDAVVEAIADAGGNATATLPLGLADVLVVPSPSLAPRLITAWSVGTPLQVDAGRQVAGVVRDPANAAIAGAQVQLTIGGVPSTLATTGADGSFAVRAASDATGPVTVDVTPPAASGLPRLTSTAAFDLGAPVQVRYAANVTRRDLAGLVIRRLGAPVASARVTVVGAIGAVGTVTAGTSAAASGEVRITTASNASGVLPSVLVPSALLSAVVAVTPGDLAVAALDTTAGVPASLDAPAMQPITTAVTDPGGARLGGAVLDLVPAGALARAAAPPIHVVADATGAITATVPAGGHYDLRFRDPAGRGAPTVIADRTPATIATINALGPAIQIRGKVARDDLSPVASAAVQLLCNDCTGLERSRPIVEGLTDASGRFVVAVPDPGKM